MGTTGRLRPHLVVEEKLVREFDPSRHPRDDHGRWAHESGSGHVVADILDTIEVVTKEALSNPDTPRTRGVTREEFATLASEGKNRLDDYRRAAAPPRGLDENWATIADRAWESVQEEWGGLTVDAHTGTPLAGDENKYALTVKPKGMQSVSIPIGAGRATFDAGMREARRRFASELANQHHYLGIFRDEDSNRIDFDPVLVVDTLHDVETIGSYTHAVGGAYNFADGNGYWPPHVVESKGAQHAGLQGTGPVAQAGRRGAGPGAGAAGGRDDGGHAEEGLSGEARPHLSVKEKPPVQMTAQEMLQALIEGKHDGRFDPAKHPRDKHGRFAHVGDLVKLADGKHGRITAVGAGGKLTVRKESGGSVTVDSKKVAKVTGEASGATDARGAARALRLLPKQGRKEGTGTLDDPIAVGADIERAAHLLAEGKHVRLDQPDQVVTLVDKLRAMVADAKSRGEKAPTFDLGKVTVPGTNLFTQESKGIPRINMPQFRGVPAPGSPAEAFRGSGGESGANIEQPFRDALAAMGIPTRHATVPASHLRASQRELDGAKVAGIAASMAAGRMPDLPIFVTRDNYIIDGHHRWAGKIVNGLRGGDSNQPVEIVDLDIGAALDYANAFARVMGIASQPIDDPGSGRAPVAAATKVIFVSSVLPSDFREQMNKALAKDATTPSVRRRAFLAVKDIAPSAALLDGEGSGEEVPVEAAVAASPVPPRRSRIADHLAAVYAQTPRHHVVRAIDAAYARAGDPPAEDAKEA